MNYETILKNAIKKIMRRMVSEWLSNGAILISSTKLVEDVLGVLGVIEIESEHAIWDWAVEVMEELSL